MSRDMGLQRACRRVLGDMRSGFVRALIGIVATHRLPGSKRSWTREATMQRTRTFDVGDKSAEYILSLEGEVVHVQTAVGGQYAGTKHWRLHRED